MKSVTFYRSCLLVMAILVATSCSVLAAKPLAITSLEGFIYPDNDRPGDSGFYLLSIPLGGMLQASHEYHLATTSDDQEKFLREHVGRKVVSIGHLARRSYQNIFVVTEISPVP